MKLNNLTDLAEFLKGFVNDSPRRKMGFDMQNTYDSRGRTDHPCGSACCIGGWVQYHNKNTRKMEIQNAVLTLAPEGMSYNGVFDLCFPHDVDSAWEATPQQAARAVEILRDTGKCDWKRAMNEVE